MKAWRERNPDSDASASRFRTRKRRGAAFGVEDILDPKVERIVLDEFGHRCARCGTREDLTLDHHLPLQSGYPLLDNAVVLCLCCNSAKGIQMPVEFYDPDTLRAIQSSLSWCTARRLVAAHHVAESEAS